MLKPSSYFNSLYPKSFYPFDFRDSRAWASVCENVSSKYQEFYGKTVKLLKHKKNPQDCAHYITESPILTEFTTAELSIFEELFMNITPMELQAHINAIQWAHGNILIGGLGMGYFLKMIKEKPDVETITVIEKNQEIIDCYLSCFSITPNIELLCGDIFTFKSDRLFDFVYIDIWPEFVIEKIESDMLEISNNIRAKLYSFWGIELYLHDHFKVFGVKDPPLFNSLGFFESCPNEKENKQGDRKRGKYKKELEDILDLIYLLTGNPEFITS